MGCGTLERGSNGCPDTPLKSGTRPRLFLANYDGVISTTPSATVPNLITAATFATGVTSFLFEGSKQDVKPTQEFIAPSNGKNQTKHGVSFIVYDITQEQKNNLQQVNVGRFVAWVENNGKNSESFEIYGLGSGMEIVPGLTRDTLANGGGYLITLATPEGEFEPLLPQTFFATDYATTLALVEEYAALPQVTTISDIALQVAGGDTETITGLNFYGNGSSSVVTSVQWVNQVTKAKTTQTSITVVSDTSITFTSVALTAGSYRLRVTTTKGFADSVQVAIAS